MPSRQSSGTSAPGRSSNRAHENRSRNAAVLGDASCTSTSTAPSTCGSSAARHASRLSGGAFEPMTTETEGLLRDEVELDIEEGIDDLAFLQVLLLGVHRPHVVGGAF